jgi:hypothetical protein
VNPDPSSQEPSAANRIRAHRDTPGAWPARTPTRRRRLWAP